MSPVTERTVRPAAFAAGLVPRPRNAHPSPLSGHGPLWANDPTAVPGYRLTGRLGRGGMADVFAARPAAGGPVVAVKILRVGGVVQSCRREFELASAVDADSTAAPIEYGVAAVGAYLVTAYLPGFRSGAAEVNPATPIGQLWQFAAAFADVLAAVHSRGVVHCDVKPSNLLVHGSDVRLIDFGISRYAGERGEDDGLVRCSRGWAAPEQLRNEPATPAVDVFAWACVLALLSTGVHPFASDDELEWILRLESARPDLVGLPAGMEEIIRAALAKDPNQRPDPGDLAAFCRRKGRRA